MKDFRIKEVTIKFIHGNELYFYPQQKGSKLVSTGHLWWKKHNLEDVWYNLYKDNKTGVHYLSKLSDTTLVVEDSIERAQAVIDEIIVASKRNSKNRYRELGVELPDTSEDVKIHPSR